MTEYETAATPPVIRASGNDFQRRMNGHLNTRFELRPLGARAYDGAILQSYVSDRLRLADIRFTPHSTRLLPGRAPRGIRNSFLISWQIEGTSLVRQGGREAHVGPGELFFIDTSSPFEIETDDIWTRSVYLDSQLWQEIFPEREFYTATALQCDTGMGRLCTDLIDQLFPAAQTHSAEVVTRMASSLANLLAVSLIVTRPVAPGRSSGDGLALERIRAFVRDNLGDPELDCAAVAAHMNLSIRHIHHLFASSGTTLMRWTWRERLCRIALDLANPALSRKSVMAIAFDWGFSDAAHFSRTFKSAYAMTPTQYRQEACRQQVETQPSRLRRH